MAKKGSLKKYSLNLSESVNLLTETDIKKLVKGSMLCHAHRGAQLKVKLDE